MNTTRVKRGCTALALAAMIGTPATSTAQDAAGCQGRAACAEVQSFVANVTDFRMSTGDRNTHLMTLTVRFQNRSAKPLILGYVTGSGIGMDDQGNRYQVYGNNSVRGIGEIASNTFDPKFVLQPGETSDARFELVFQAPAGKILGTRYEGDLTIREIVPAAGNQFRLGREHALHFRGLGEGSVASAGTSQQPPVSSQTASAAPPAPVGDACAGKARCFATGPFAADVDQFNASTEGNRRYHVLRVNLRVRNVSNQPIILAYKATTSGATDNLGNRYYWGRPGTYDMSVTGIGKVEGSKADPQFSLAPGEARTATFSLIRYDANGHELGTSFTHDLTLTQLEILPSQQVRVMRDYAITFKELGATGSDAAKAAGGAAANKLIDALRKRVGKP